MIIIDFFGFSGSGKSFLAKKISSLNSEIDNQFLNIAKELRIKRLLQKLYYISLVKFSDIKLILELQNSFIFNNKIIKIKNLLSFLYIIGYIKSKSDKTKILLLDHGFIQCILSCFLFSKSKNYNLENITEIVSKLYLSLDVYFDYYNIVVMNHNWKLISERLLKRDGIKSKKLIKENKLNFFNESLNNCKFIYSHIHNEKFKTFDAESFSVDNYYEFTKALKLYEKPS